MDKIVGYFKGNKVLFLIILFLLNFLTADLAFAAFLYTSPAIKSVGVGDSFSLTVFVGSSDQALNAVSSEITWSSDTLKLINFSKSQSIIKFWVKEPEVLDNQIDFEGVIFNPGYMGNNGKILTLNFRALKEGTAEVNFSSGMVLANDGQGTNILSAMNGTKIVINKRVQEVTEVEEEKSSRSEVISIVSLPKPEIFSLTHPNQQKWYNNNKAIFEWRVPVEVAEVRTGYGDDPYLIPKVSYSPPISKRQLENIPDGSHYFAVQFVSDNYLSEISRFKFNIDTQPPQFEELSLDLIDQNLLSLKVRLKDELSGVEELNIYLDGQLVKKISGVNYYEEILKNINSGSHIVKIEAIDKAGNQEEKIEKIIIPQSPQIIIEKDYTIYLIIALLILILSILIIWFYILRRKLEDVRQEVTLQRLDNLKKDFHNYFSEFLRQARNDLSLLDNNQQLNEKEKEIYRQIKEVIEETEMKIKNILDKFK